MSQMSDVRASGEVVALKRFFSMLSEDPERAIYGPIHCLMAADRQAIETLLITDDLFRFEKKITCYAFPSMCQSVRKSFS